LETKKKILFIINPISGVRKKNSIPDLIKKHLNSSVFDHQIEYTRYRNHAHEITLHQKNNYDAIIAVGGDGSVNEVASALVNSNCALGVIPCGSGNGFARHAEIPLKISNAIQRINQFLIQKIDTGTINNHFFVGTCGMGFDAHIAMAFDTYHKRGFLSYIRLVIRELKKYQSPVFIVDTGKEKVERKALFCSGANASQFGNGFTISPKSNLSDGKIELVFIEPVSKIKYLLLAARFFLKSIHQSKKFHVINFTDQIKISTKNNTEIPFHADGEPIGKAKNFTIQPAHHSLLLI